MKALVALWLCCLMNSTLAESKPWTEQEKLLGTVALALHATDVAQTTYGLRQGYHEMNPLLGRHPHEDKLAGFFVLSSLATYYFLDTHPEHRKVSLYAIIGFKSILVGRHMEMGLKVRF